MTKEKETVVKNEIMPIQLGMSIKVTSLAEKMAKEDEIRGENGPKYFSYVFMSNKANTPQEAPQRELFISEYIGGRQLKRQVKMPYFVSLIATRDCIRIFDGTKYTDRYLEPIPGIKSQSGAKFKAQKAIIDEAVESFGYNCDEAKTLGYKHLLYLVEDLDGTPVYHIVTMEAFKSEKSYFSRPLSEALASDYKCAEILIKNHKCNLGQSKGGEYLKGSSFNQYRVRELTLEERKEMAKLFQSVQDNELKNFLET